MRGESEERTYSKFDLGASHEHKGGDALVDSIKDGSSTGIPTMPDVSNSFGVNFGARSKQVYPPPQVDDLLRDQDRIGSWFEARTCLRSIDQKRYNTCGRNGNCLVEELFTIRNRGVRHQPMTPKDGCISARARR